MAEYNQNIANQLNQSPPITSGSIIQTHSSDNHDEVWSSTAYSGNFTFWRYFISKSRSSKGLTAREIWIYQSIDANNRVYVLILYLSQLLPGYLAMILAYFLTDIDGWPVDDNGGSISYKTEHTMGDLGHPASLELFLESLLCNVAFDRTQGFTGEPAKECSWFVPDVRWEVLVNWDKDDSRVYWDGKEAVELTGLMPRYSMTILLSAA